MTEHIFDEAAEAWALSYAKNAANVVIAYAEAHPDTYETANVFDIYKWYLEQIHEEEK